MRWYALWRIEWVDDHIWEEEREKIKCEGILWDYYERWVVEFLNEKHEGYRIYTCNERWSVLS